MITGGVGGDAWAAGRGHPREPCDCLARARFVAMTAISKDPRQARAKKAAAAKGAERSAGKGAAVADGM